MQGIDIATLDTTTLSEQGVAMPLRDPRVRRDYEQADDTRPLLTDADGKHVTITVLGPDNPKVSRMLLPQRARFQTQALATQGRKGVTFTVEDMRREEAENIDIAVAATVAWSGFTRNGEPFPCTAENARTLYTTNADIRDQVIAFVRDRGNFLPRASTV
jgi:hypothetical protein